MKSSASVLLLLGLLVPSSSAAPDPALLDRSGDELLRGTFIPSPHNVHGEFRLLRRGEATCAQTLLYTPSLRRALQRIRKKEMRCWPAGQPGHEDSLAYLEALEQAKARVLGPAPAIEPSPRLQTLAIEFVAGSSRALFAIYELEIVESDGRVTPGALRPIVVREASPHYIRAAIEHMQDSAFAAGGDEDAP
jgi:hypothetical protein